MIELSTGGARAVMIAAQGLAERPRPAPEKADVLDAIRRMGALQIDTIHVVARSPYLVLWSRLGDYEARWLDELLAEGQVFEYWSHAACFLPAEDYPLYRRRMLDARGAGWNRFHEWMRKHGREVARVLDYVRANGPTRSSDFVRSDGKAGGWWEWKPEKRALEMLFTAGELMIARRHNFQRIYDLRERVRPTWDDSRLPTADEARRALVLKAARALGVTKAGWVADYFRTDKRGTAAAVRASADEGALLRVKVAGWDEDGFAHPEHRELVERAGRGLLRATRTTLLSPFDPLVWDRARASETFGFDYRLECYTPAPQRRYGYFTLPILHEDELVGRLDAKARRRDGVFEVRALHLEDGVRVRDELVDAVARALAECASWHKTPEVVVARTSPARLSPPLRRALKRL